MRVSVFGAVRRLLCLAALVAGFASSSVQAQDSSSSVASPAAAGTELGPEANAGFGGGAAQADFDTLINLIQQTIEPDSWLSAGGTNTILPYPSGVYVDPKGHMRRVEESKQLDDQLFRQSGRLAHPWRTTSKLRTISLKGLDQALGNALQSGIAPVAELRSLAGLQKISYVKVDTANEDVLIAGPAGNSVLGFELQDLAVVAALINSETSPMGCSIEPTNDGLLAAQNMIHDSGALKRLARNPRKFVADMQDKIGPHRVRVFGMESNTGTAVALIDVDEHMKKLGFGTAKTQVPVNSYFDHLEALGGKTPTQSIIRWWFSFADVPVKVNASERVFQLPEQCVAVLSEQQWVSQQGRAPTGQQDPAADAFAKGLTSKLDALRRTHPAYARLHAVFEASLALQLACETTGQPSLEAWLPNLCRLGRAAPEQNPEPQTVAGLTTWHKMNSGNIVAVVSGGVKVDALSLARQEDWERSKFLSTSSVPESPANPSFAHGQWWWDL